MKIGDRLEIKIDLKAHTCKKYPEPWVYDDWQVATTGTYLVAIETGPHKGAPRPPGVPDVSAWLSAPPGKCSGPFASLYDFTGGITAREPCAMCAGSRKAPCVECVAGRRHCDVCADYPEDPCYREGHDDNGQIPCEVCDGKGTYACDDCEDGYQDPVKRFGQVAGVPFDRELMGRALWQIGAATETVRLSWVASALLIAGDGWRVVIMPCRPDVDRGPELDLCLFANPLLDTGPVIKTAKSAPKRRKGKG